MSESYEITLEVDGDRVPVTLEEPGPMTQVRISSELIGIDPRTSTMMSVDIDIEEHIRRMITEVTDFPPELLDELPGEEFEYLMRATARVFTGNDPDDPIGHELDPEHNPSEVNDPFANLDLNDDGTLDPDDWR